MVVKQGEDTEPERQSEICGNVSRQAYNEALVCGLKGPNVPKANNLLTDAGDGV